MRGRAVLSAILLTLHEGQLPANQLPSRMNKLDRVLGNGEGRGEMGRQYKVFHNNNNSNSDNVPNGAAIQISSESKQIPDVAGHTGLDLPALLRQVCGSKWLGVCKYSWLHNHIATWFQVLMCRSMMKHQYFQSHMLCN